MPQQRGFEKWLSDQVLIRSQAEMIHKKRSILFFPHHIYFFEEDMMAIKEQSHGTFSDPFRNSKPRDEDSQFHLNRFLV
jgi:hypothetical protein